MESRTIPSWNGCTKGCLPVLGRSNQAGFAPGSTRQLQPLGPGRAIPTKPRPPQSPWGSSDKASPGAAASVKRAQAAPGPPGACTMHVEDVSATRNSVEHRRRPLLRGRFIPALVLQNRPGRREHAPARTEVKVDAPFDQAECQHRQARPRLRLSRLGRHLARHAGARRGLKHHSPTGRSQAPLTGCHVLDRDMPGALAAQHSGVPGL